MHRRFRRVLAVAVVASVPPLLAACGDGTGGRGGMGGMEEMMRMMGGRHMELPEGIPASELPDPDGPGARLVATYCGQCHGIPSPRRHAAEDWGATARRMFRRMAHMEGMGGGMGRMRGGRMEVEAPTAGEERAILAYLREHAMRGAREGALPEGDGREAFVRICSRCHALPDPRQRAAEEWPTVVERMRGHMERMEVEGITDAEAERVVRYLQGASERRR